MIKLWHYSNRHPEKGTATDDVPHQIRSLDELTRQLSAGVFTTFRTYHKFSILNLAAHIRRLERSAAMLGKPLTINQPALRANLRTALENHPAAEARVRVILTWEGTDQVETIYLAVEELKTPSPELYQTGVRVKTVLLERNLPEAKATEFIQQTKKLREEITDGLNELLMIGADGIIREGLSSNFFAVIDGCLCTTSVGVLPGITREIVLELAQTLSIPLIMDGVHLDEINRAQEAFLTSASRGVLPVVQIDQTVIGSGVPGPITRQLMQAYAEEIKRRIEVI